MRDQPWTDCSVTLAMVLLFTASSLPAQHAAIAVGYSSMPGRIGNAQSDHGMVARVGLDLATGRHLEWALEGGVERLNEDHVRFSQDCLLPNDAIVTCQFDSRSRDTGWSLGSILRWSAGGGSFRPYLLAGAGYLSVGDHYRSSATDDHGNSVPNFAADGTSRDAALQLDIGAGVRHQPVGAPVGFLVEGRASRLIHNYSGGLQWDWNPTVTVGLRLGRRASR